MDRWRCDNLFLGVYPSCLRARRHHGILLQWLAVRRPNLAVASYLLICNLLSIAKFTHPVHNQSCLIYFYKGNCVTAIPTLRDDRCTREGCKCLQVFASA